MFTDRTRQCLRYKHDAPMEREQALRAHYSFVWEAFLLRITVHFLYVRCCWASIRFPMYAAVWVLFVWPCMACGPEPAWRWKLPPSPHQKRVQDDGCKASMLIILFICVQSAAVCTSYEYQTLYISHIICITHVSSVILYVESTDASWAW